MTTIKTSAEITIIDLDGNNQVITENLSNLTIITKLSNANDYFSYYFSFDIVNISDAYSYIQKGCNIEIETGIDGSNTKKVSGNITEASKTLDAAKITPIISVSGTGGGTRLNKIFFSGKFYDTEVSALVKDVLDSTDFTTGETYRTLAAINASNEYIESTVYSVDEATYVWASLEAAITELAENVGYEWYRDVDGKLHFFDPAAAEVVAQITEADLDGVPEITEIGDIINRVVVIGGFQQNTDKSGNTQTTTTTVTDSTAKNQSFVPDEDYLSSILIYTELVTDSVSAITLSIQKDSAAAPDGINIANGLKVVKTDKITDAGYTEFRFASDVTLTPGETYWMVLKGSTADGVKVGIDGSAVLDYVTRYPVRVAVMVNDDESQETYKNADGTPGIYMKVLTDSKIEDSEYAEQVANSLLSPNSKKIANITVHGDTISAGDVVLLKLTTSGVGIDKNMKVKSSTQTLNDLFILNKLELVEL
jgi:RPA family protein